MDRKFPITWSRGYQRRFPPTPSLASSPKKKEFVPAIATIPVVPVTTVEEPIPVSEPTTVVGFILGKAPKTAAVKEKITLIPVKERS